MVRRARNRNRGRCTTEARESRAVRRDRRGYHEVRPRQRRNCRRKPRSCGRTRAVRTRTTEALAEGTRIGELPQATADRRATPRRPEAKASGLSSQALELLCSGIRPRSGRRSRCEGTDGTSVEQPKPRRSGVGDVPANIGVQVRPGRNALRRRRSTRDDQRVLSVRRRSRKAAVGARTLVSVMWVRDGPRPQCCLQHPFSRTHRSRGGSPRFNVVRESFALS